MSRKYTYTSRTKLLLLLIYQLFYLTKFQKEAKPYCGARKSSSRKRGLLEFTWWQSRRWKQAWHQETEVEPCGGANWTRGVFLIVVPPTHLSVSLYVSPLVMKALRNVFMDSFLCFFLSLIHTHIWICEGVHAISWLVHQLIRLGDSSNCQSRSNKPMRRTFYS